MYNTTHLLLALILAASTLIVAYPYPYTGPLVSQDHYEVLRMRLSSNIDPSAISRTRCVDPDSAIVFHDQNVAELAICGGIAGSVRKCAGTSYWTVGASGSARFELIAVDREKGAVIDITKDRWERCVRAAVAVCPTGSFESICLGGASSGDVKFGLVEQ